MIGVFMIMLSMLIPLESNKDALPEADVCTNEFGSSIKRFMHASSECGLQLIISSILVNTAESSNSG